MLANNIIFKMISVGVSGVVTVAFVDLCYLCWKHIKASVLGFTRVTEALGSGDAVTIARPVARYVEMQGGGIPDAIRLIDRSAREMLVDDVVDKVKSLIPLSTFGVMSELSKMIRSRMEFEPVDQVSEDDILKVILTLYTSEKRQQILVEMQGDVESGEFKDSHGFVSLSNFSLDPEMPVCELLKRYKFLMQEYFTLLRQRYDNARMDDQLETLRRRIVIYEDVIRGFTTADERVVRVVNMQIDIPDNYPEFMEIRDEIKLKSDRMARMVFLQNDKAVSRQERELHRLVSKFSTSLKKAVDERKRAIVDIEMQVNGDNVEYVEFYRHIKHATKQKFEYRDTSERGWQIMEGKLNVPSNILKLFKYCLEHNIFSHQSLKINSEYSVDFWLNKDNFNLQLVKSIILSDKQLVVAQAACCWIINRDSPKYVGSNMLGGRWKQIEGNMLHNVQRLIGAYLREVDKADSSLKISHKLVEEVAVEQCGVPKAVGTVEDYHVQLTVLEGHEVEVAFARTHFPPKRWDPTRIVIQKNGLPRLTDSMKMGLFNYFFSCVSKWWSAASELK